MAQAQLSDSEGSHSADSMLEGTAEAATQPKGTGLSQEAGKTWLSLPAKRCQQRCVPLDAMSEGPRTEIAVPRLGQELPSCVPSHGDPNLGPGEGLSQPECASFHTREDTLHHSVKLMERRELKHWMRCHEVMGLDAMILVF